MRSLWPNCEHTKHPARLRLAFVEPIRSGCLAWYFFAWLLQLLLALEKPEKSMPLDIIKRSLCRRKQLRLLLERRNQ